jgi:hypothetical protein
MDKLIKRLKELSDLVPLEENFNSWKGNLSQVDDLVILGIRI